MEATNIRASALAIVASKSLVSGRQSPSQAKVRSTTHRHGRTSKPLAMSERLMISMVHVPRSASACVSFSPGIAAVGE